MPRGRHRQAPPLHRLLVPSAIAGLAFVCVVVSLLVSGTVVSRLLTLLTAICAVTGAVLLRLWDRSAGLRVGEAKAAGDDAQTRAETRAAEIEAALREAHEVRGKLERRLRGRRAELARLRTAHAILLQRYATAETERANALEGRRQLAIAAAEPVKELTASAADHRSSSGAPTALTYLQAAQALSNLKRAASRQRAQGTVGEGAEQRPRQEGPASQRERFDFFGVTQATPTPPSPQPAPQPDPPTASNPPTASKPAFQDSPYAPVRARQVASKVIDVTE